MTAHRLELSIGHGPYVLVRIDRPASDYSPESTTDLATFSDWSTACRALAARR